MRKKHTIRLDLSLVGFGFSAIIVTNFWAVWQTHLHSDLFRELPVMWWHFWKDQAGSWPREYTLLSCSPWPWDTFTSLLWCHNRRRGGEKVKELIPHHSQCLRAVKCKGCSAEWGEQGTPATATSQPGWDFLLPTHQTHCDPALSTALTSLKYHQCD